MALHILHALTFTAACILPALIGAILLPTSLKAMEREYVVAKIEGAAPQSVPVPGLPSRFLQAGQSLFLGEGYLMLPNAVVILATLDSGEFFTVNGPNRFAIGQEGPEAYNPAGLIRHEKIYFADPALAVTQVAQLLVDGNWLELALCYDFAGHRISPAALLSGEFFLREEQAQAGHPGGFDRYKEPFSPSFSYSSHYNVAEDEVRVNLSISIDQGGGMVQEGRDAFHLRKTGKGYRLLPRSVWKPEPEFIPPSDPGPGPGPLK